MTPIRDRGRAARARRPSQPDEIDAPEPVPPHVGRVLNEAAHKLPNRSIRPVEPKRALSRSPAVSSMLRAAPADDRDVIADAGRVVLALGALGVVFGDIGTSPLYTVQTIFTAHADAAHPTVAGVYGIVSEIFWALTIMVSVKYAGFIMRVHNHGDGGIMALTALVQRHRLTHAGALVALGIFGAGLFFGDGIITPAISVTSAVEGLKVAAPALTQIVVPISLAILVGLFAVQRLGTGTVGWLFGPVLLLWFVAIAALGTREVLTHPGVIQGLSPVWAMRFMVGHGLAALLTLGGVVLAVTGAEALYADRGHFGAGPIRFTWFAVVLPAVLLSYLGQAALIRAHPATIANPFYLLVPPSLRLPMVMLATAATIIASQAVITGSFSLASQAAQLHLLPRLRIVHTSALEGRIYVPLVNWGLGVGVVGLVLVFRSSARLADIYGVAVSGTFILNTILFVAVSRSRHPWARWRWGVLGALFLTVEGGFFFANLAKVSNGGWLSLAAGLLIASAMLIWRRGQERLTDNRTTQEGPLSEFLSGLPMLAPPPRRVPGVAIFLSPSGDTTPLAMRAQVEHVHALQERLLIVSVEAPSIPHIGREDQVGVEWLGERLFKVAHVTVRAGYRDRVDVPHALAEARKRGLLERNLDLEHGSYLLSRMMIVQTGAPGMSRWAKSLFILMARNVDSPVSHFRLPEDRVVIMGSQVTL